MTKRASKPALFGWGLANLGSMLLFSFIHLYHLFKAPFGPKAFFPFKKKKKKMIFLISGFGFKFQAKKDVERVAKLIPQKYGCEAYTVVAKALVTQTALFPTSPLCKLWEVWRNY